jgi:hypothetical protein
LPVDCPMATAVSGWPALLLRGAMTTLLLTNGATSIQCMRQKPTKVKSSFSSFSVSRLRTSRHVKCLFHRGLMYIWKHSYTGSLWFVECLWAEMGGGGEKERLLFPDVSCSILGYFTNCTNQKFFVAFLSSQANIVIGHLNRAQHVFCHIFVYSSSVSGCPWRPQLEHCRQITRVSTVLRNAVRAVNRSCGQNWKTLSPLYPSTSTMSSPC